MVKISKGSQTSRNEGPSSVSKGPYRPLSPRVGPQATSSAGVLRPRQVIVSSPGSPSSSSDSQSGSESVKHCLPSRVSSPVIRASPSSQTILRSSPSVTINSPGLRHSPSITSAVSGSSPGPRNSPSISSLSRASPSILGQVSRSSSPAMQASSAGLNVTLGTTTPSFTSTFTNLQSSMAMTSTGGYGWNYAQASTYTQPTTYASTNPFLTGSYMSYTPGDSTFSEKFNTIGPSKEVKSFFDSYTSDTNKYSTLNTKSTSYDSEYLYSSPDIKTNGVSSRYLDKSYLNSTYSTDLNKYSPAKNAMYDTSPNVTQSTSSSTSGLLNVEETPTPTSSIETEDSNTREVGEKDVEGDGEQSD
ncbi:unnamed protein product [Diabrotica balteata]|uniref:Uncharacterized protein n=1 Tax=Diabrotica balteata TaxID=107213 RepID=A0A9N9SRX1_DIABA|nr:unnamed protein product [Diabrotica balteata]